jgi:hypothetical protein
MAGLARFAQLALIDARRSGTGFFAVAACKG